MIKNTKQAVETKIVITKQNKPKTAINHDTKDFMDVARITGKKISAETAKEIVKDETGIELAQVNEIIQNSPSKLDAARAYANRLTSKMVKMTLNKASIDKEFYDSLINRFTVDGVQVGNGYEYIGQIMGGSEPFDINKFVPNALIETNSRTQLCSFDETRKFPVHLSDISLLEFFVNPVVLGEFLAKLRDYVMDSVSTYLFNKLVQTLTGFAGVNTITGTATTNFDSWIELSKHINKMSAYTYDYSIDGTIAAGDRLPKATPKSDIVILMNADTATSMKMGVSSGLYHNTLWENKDNITIIEIAGKQINLGAPGAIPTETGNQLIGLNDIYVLEKDALRLFFGFKETSNQQYGENLVFVFNVFIKYGIDVIRFLKGFKYTNPNLNNL